MKSRFLDRGQTTDGRDIQIRVPGPHDDGWYLVTIADRDGNLISISCGNMDEAEEAATWLEQYSVAEIPARMRERFA